MKKVLIAIALAVVLSSALCHADNIHEFTLAWTAASNQVSISLQTSSGGVIVSSFGGTFSNVAPMVPCDAPCTGLSVDFQVSGLTASNVIYKSKLYSTVYFSGSLDIATPVHFLDENGQPQVNGIPVFGSTHIVGNLEACSDPSCNHSLFDLPIDGFALTHPSVQFAYNSSGQLIETSAFLHTTPEPSDLALVGTGCLFLLRRVRRMAIKR